MYILWTQFLDNQILTVGTLYYTKMFRENIKELIDKTNFNH